MLADVEIDSLSIAVQIVLSDMRHVPWTGEYMDQLRREGRSALAGDMHLPLIREIRMFGVASHIAALSTVRGGVLIDGYLFCATHHPGGIAARGYTKCQPCRPARSFFRRSF